MVHTTLLPYRLRLPTLALLPVPTPVLRMWRSWQYPLALGPRYLWSWRVHLVQSPGVFHLIFAAPGPVLQ